MYHPPQEPLVLKHPEAGALDEPASVPEPLDQVVFDRRIVKVRRNVLVDLFQVMLVLVLLVAVVLLPSRSLGVDRHAA